MIVTILHRLEGTPKVTTQTSTGQWFSDAVNWVIENQIVDETFMPKETITREQLADVFYRYIQYKGGDTTQRADLSSYTDSDVLSANTKEAMQWANAVGLIGGMTDTTRDPQGYTTRDPQGYTTRDPQGYTTRDPQGYTTRDQLATILMRFCNK